MQAKADTDDTHTLTVTINRAEGISGLSRATLYRLMDDGKLRSKKVLGRRLIIYKSLEKLLADEEPAVA
jgi:predicted DNA-binding transcriptional regulator AlpA